MNHIETYILYMCIIVCRLLKLYFIPSNFILSFIFQELCTVGSSYMKHWTTFTRGETLNFHNANNNNYVIIFIATFVDCRR